MVSTLKKAEPNSEDIMAARFVGRGHPYWADGLLDVPTDRYNDEHTVAEADYHRLLEIVMCRERELELALAQLTNDQRAKVGL